MAAPAASVASRAASGSQGEAAGAQVAGAGVYGAASALTLLTDGASQVRCKGCFERQPQSFYSYPPEV